MTDYALRGEALEKFNVLQLFVDTYEENISPTDRANYDTSEIPSPSFPDTASRRGHTRHERCRYMEAHPRYAQRQRVIRSKFHRNLPNIVGRFFVRHDDPACYPLYCAMMLMLLKPWRNIATDLKRQQQSWEEAFGDLCCNADERTKYAISGIQHYHECSEAARHRNSHEELLADDIMEASANEGELNDEDLPMSSVDGDPTAEGLKANVAALTSVQERIHAQLAMEHAKQAQIFEDSVPSWSVQVDCQPKPATGGDVVKISEWRALMQADVAKQNENVPNAGPAEVTSDAHVSLLVMDERNEHENGQVSAFHTEATIPAVDASFLNVEQLRAYNIIRNHLLATIAGQEPLPALASHRLFNL